MCNGENAKVLGTVRRSGRCHVNSDHPAAAQPADAPKTAMKTLSGSQSVVALHNSFMEM